MNRFSWHIKLGLMLLLVSAVTYAAQLHVFGRTTDTFFYMYMMQDLAFLPTQVLLVTLILNALLTRREKSQIRYKMNMVIGTFFAEMGDELLARLSTMDEDAEELRQATRLSVGFSRDEFRELRNYLCGRDCRIAVCPGDLRDLTAFLVANRAFVLGLLGNANLLEHEAFTDLLWAVSHLSEELVHRDDVESTSQTDREHLCNDIVRAYQALSVQWLSYAEHLKDQYPYMYSLVVRTNPFQPGQSAEVE